MSDERRPPDRPPTPGGLDDVPSMDESPLVWDHRVGGFVPAAGPTPSAAPPPAPSTPPSPAPSGYPAPAPSAPPSPAPSGYPPPVPPMPPDGTQVLPSSPVAAAPSARRHVVINAGEQSVRPRTPAPASSGASPGSNAPYAPTPVPPPNWSPPPGPPPPGPTAPPARPPKRRRRSRRRILKLVLSTPVVLLLLLVAFGYYKFEQIPRVPVKQVLSTGGTGTNWLIVGTDSREGIDPDAPDAGAFLGGGEPTGSRTDSIMVLRVGGDGQALLSVPRDLWVKDPSTGEMGRINSTFGAGPANLITAVRNLGIPVHHYLEINFVSFGRLVDAVGGITVPFAAPARDTHSGLDVPAAGEQHLDGTQALAYVRSRYYEELEGGKWVADPLSDLGRVQRQRSFLTALMSKVAGTKNPFTLLSVSNALSAGTRLDDDLNLFGALGLAGELRGFSPESATLPTTGRRTSGGADVLDLDKAKAAAVLQQFGA